MVKSDNHSAAQRTACKATQFYLLSAAQASISVMSCSCYMMSNLNFDVQEHAKWSCIIPKCFPRLHDAYTMKVIAHLQRNPKLVC